jgi:GNAT superfamily N-acetyltransferase
LQTRIVIRRARDGELAALAQHYLGMRRELEWPDSALVPDWEQRFIRHHARGADAGELCYFVAEADGRIVGSAVALTVTSFTNELETGPPRGYLANIFVEKPWRKQGIARDLTSAALDWLRSIGCAFVHLRASEFGRPLYESMGFVPSGEMVLRLGDEGGNLE